jgi:hypothetical protein
MEPRAHVVAELMDDRGNPRAPASWPRRAGRARAGDGDRGSAGVGGRVAGRLLREEFYDGHARPPLSEESTSGPLNPGNTECGRIAVVADTGPTAALLYAR